VGAGHGFIPYPCRLVLDISAPRPAATGVHFVPFQASCLQLFRMGIGGHPKVPDEAGQKSLDSCRLLPLAASWHQRLWMERRCTALL